MSATAEAAPLRPAPFTRQVRLLSSRVLLEAVRNPAVAIPNLAITVFFLLVYNGAFGDASAVTALAGGNYLNFILPVVILFASLAGGAAGLALVRDIEEGFFRRQLAMPLSRTAIVLGPILAGAVQVVAQAVLILVLGLILGADPETGILGLLVVTALALFWGLGFAGYSVATGLATGNAQAAQSATLIFFPLVFLSPIFLPEDQLQDWLQVAAKLNPTTYVLGGMRSLLIEGWQPEEIAKGFAAAAGFAAAMLAAAVAVARRKTARG